MISVVVSYCNNDLKFIKDNISEIKKFSDDIVVVYCDFSFDGSPEDQVDILKMKDICNGLKISKIDFDKNNNAIYHHNLMRSTGLEKSEKYSHVLFLDADEIFDGEKMKSYLYQTNWSDYDAISFKCYWYFREKYYRATTTEEAGVLLRKSIINNDLLFSNAERFEFCNRYLNKKHSDTYNGDVLCHHYSWARTKEEMLKKVKTWAHKNDKDWVSLIEDEFKEDFKNRDFIHNYNFIKI